jgi:glycosyltransferase involved in cell wall biosynthesis
MKLLVVSSWFPYPPDNGSKLRAYALLTQLAKQHAITLLSFAESGEERGAPALDGLCHAVRTVSGNPFKAGQLTVRHLFAREPRSLAQTYSRSMQRLVDRELATHDAAIAFQIGAAPYLARHDSIPRILEELEVGVLRDQYRKALTWRGRARHGLTWWKVAQYTRRLVETFDATTVVSDLERSHLQAARCDLTRVHVLPNGVDARTLAVNRQAAPARLIYPGSITYAANLDAVAFLVDQVFPAIRARRPDVTLDITGGTGGADLQRFGHGRGVTFTGRVDDIAGRIAESTVCVVPLRIGGGTRLKILEAMAVGTPVVATPKGIEGLEVAPERDVLVGDTPEELARQVMRVLEEPGLRDRLARAGRDLIARRYTWDRIGTQLEALLDQVSAPGRVRADRSPVREPHRVLD